MPMVVSRAGRTHLERPHHRPAELRIVDHDAKPSVRIGPFELFHRALKGDGLLGVEHGEGMMGKSGRRDGGQRDGGQADDFHVHRRLPNDWPTGRVFDVIIMQYSATVQGGGAVQATPTPHLKTLTFREESMRFAVLAALMGVALAAMTTPAAAQWRPYISHPLGFAFAAPGR